MADNGSFQISQTDEVAKSDTVLTSNVITNTSLDWLKNSRGAERVRWSDLSEEIITVTATFATQRLIDYVALPTTNFPANAEYQVEALSSGADQIGMPLTPVSPDFQRYGSTVAHFLDTPVLSDAVRFSIRHLYGFVDAGDPPPVVISDNTPRQGADGTLSFEAENAISVGIGGDQWQEQTDTDASNGFRMAKLDSRYYWNASDGPYLDFIFTAAQSGLHDIWLRIRSDEGTSIHTTVPEGSTLTVFSGASAIVGNGWQWRNVRHVNLNAEQTTRIRVSAAAQRMQLDKIVVLPVGTAAPTGQGPAQSADGTITQTADGETTLGDTVEIRQMMAGVMLKLQRGISFGPRFKRYRPPGIEESYSGHALAPKPQQKARELTVNFPLFQDQERYDWTLLEDNFQGRPVFINAYPAPQPRNDIYTQDQMFLARMRSEIEYGHEFNDRHGFSNTFLEA